MSVSVTFDRPLAAGTFTLGDIQVFYHDTTNGDPPVPLTVQCRPGHLRLAAQLRLHAVHGHLRPLRAGTPAEPGHTLQLHRDVQLPDRAGQWHRHRDRRPIWSFGNGALREDAPMDQNANGTVDQNAVTTPFTGLTPGDVYAVPTPQPVTAVTFVAESASILHPPFNQNTLPLIVPGPQVFAKS